MTSGLPEGVGPDDEIELNSELEDGRWRVSARLQSTTITIDTDTDTAETVPWLLASMPHILEAAWAALEEQLQED